MDNRIFDTGEPLSDKESTGLEKAFIVFGDGNNRIEIQGKVMVDGLIDFEATASSMGSMTFPRIGEVSGQMVIDTMAELYELFEEGPRERKPLSRQESFGSYLRKGKKW